MPTECPRCNTSDISVIDTDNYEGDSETKYVKCEGCKFEWAEIWECTSWLVRGALALKNNDDRSFKPDEKYSEVVPQ